MAFRPKVVPCTEVVSNGAVRKFGETQSETGNVAVVMCHICISALNENVVALI